MAMAGFLLTGNKARPGLRRKLVIVFVSAGLLSGTCQGWRTFCEEAQFRALVQPRIVMTKFLDKLIKEQGKKPGFSIYVSPEFPGNYKLLNIFTKSDSASMEFTYVNMLYWPYIQPVEKAEYKLLVVDQQTYLFCVRDKCGPALRAMVDML